MMKLMFMDWKKETSFRDRLCGQFSILFDPHMC
jgi:hypothetical protein